MPISRIYLIPGVCCRGRELLQSFCWKTERLKTRNKWGKSSIEFRIGQQSQLMGLYGLGVTGLELPSHHWGCSELAALVNSQSWMVSPVEEQGDWWVGCWGCVGLGRMLSRVSEALQWVFQVLWAKTKLALPAFQTRNYCLESSLLRGILQGEKQREVVVRQR